MTAHVVLYHTASCPYCVRAERLLEAKGVADIERIRVDLDPEQRFRGLAMDTYEGGRWLPSPLWELGPWSLGSLRTVPGHQPSSKHLAYRRALFGGV